MELEDALAAMRKRHRHITVAIDSGTVWRRYLAVVLLQPKGPLTVRGSRYRSELLVLRDMHAELIPESAREANDFLALALQDVDGPARVTENDIATFMGVKIATFPETTRLLSRLLDVCPTEADCERVFSKLKLSLNPHRSHTSTVASTAHVFFNSGREYLEETKKISKSLTMQPPTFLPRELFQWILSTGAPAYAKNVPAAVTTTAGPAAAAPEAAAAAQAGTRRPRELVDETVRESQNRYGRTIREPRVFKY